MVGGDFDAIDQREHDYHKAPEIDLKDVWKDVPAPPPPESEPFQKDLTYGRARGNTWGYQSEKSRSRKRLDEFFYTGSLETLPVVESQGLAGKIGRLGIGLKTKIGAWKLEQAVEGRPDNINSAYVSEDAAASMRPELDAWVSDHFGITVAIRALGGSDS